MRNIFLSGAILALLIPAASPAQVPLNQAEPRPTLKRDRTQRLLYPKIIQFEDERAGVAELVAMLSSPHGGIRRRAVIALGRIGSPAAVTALVDLLNNDRYPEVRALAAFALGEIESHYAAKDLLARTQSANEPTAAVRARAAEALGKIVSNKASAEALGNYAVSGISDALARLLPPVDQPPSKDAKMVATLTLTALLRIKQPSFIDAIANQLRSKDAEVRWHAANALARIREGVTGATPLLLPLLTDADPLVRANAARALAVTKDASAVAPLIKLLADPDERVVASAVNALGAIPDARAVEPLIALGTSKFSEYRAFNQASQGIPAPQNLLLLVASSLGNIKDPRALPFLKTIRLVDNRISPHPEIEIAVAKFGEAAFFDLPEGLVFSKDDWKSMAAYAQGLGELRSERAKSTLLDLLAGKSYGRPDARAVSDILTALSAVKAEGLKDILLGQLRTEDVIVRTTSATLLGELGDSSDTVSEALQAAFKVARLDKMNDARIAILEAADKLKRPMNIQALDEQTKDSDYIVRMKAWELLRQSSTDPSTSRLNPGKAETGHDRAYWKRMADLTSVSKNPKAVLHTKKGKITIELFAADAPMTVDNFMQLAKSGYFDGLTFMRVVPNFVIQGGDPRNDMNGGPGYQIRDEINLKPYATGTVGMALSGKDTGGSQFFITHSPQPHLDGGYTVFGQVVDGLDSVMRVARGERIERVEIIEGVK